ncbi:beta-1,3-glucan-binding protein [Patella vulgata]|uniref:beta-1,3-glucan-binding protein n=1 Tax=Patella vulgata TaxID=6465 RepID=UPI00217F5684|nr:beta-1,3-glucan-binding protein [Patella vulgata]
MVPLLILIWSVCVACAIPVPDPKFILLADGGGQFSSDDIPDAISVRFRYAVDGEFPKHGEAIKIDNVWYFTDPKIPASGSIEYFTMATLSNGDIALSQTITWKSAPMATLPPRRMRGAVMFRDDFNGNHLNTNNWLIQVTATGEWHREFQVYTHDPQNVFLRNGHLYLKPTLTVDNPHFTENDLYHGILDVKKTWGVCTDNGFHGCYRNAKDGLLPPLLSGRVDSKPTLRYGTVTVRAQIPRGDWLWPAIWLMPKAQKYGYWPRSGEIDMMEASCNEVMHWTNGGQKIGVQRVTSSIHLGPDASGDRHITGAKYKTSGDWHGFHTYKLDWSPDHVILYVDDQMVTRVDVHSNTNMWQHLGFHGNNIWSGGSHLAPFDQEFYLILNVATGGAPGIFGENGVTYAYPKPWQNNAKDPMAQFWSNRNNWLPTWHGDDVAMIIDYVEFRHV